jgi:hypothetical protein
VRFGISTVSNTSTPDLTVLGCPTTDPSGKRNFSLIGTSILCVGACTSINSPVFNQLLN